MTPDHLADRVLFLRVQGGIGYQNHNPNPFPMVHYLLQMVHRSFISTSTRYLQAQAVQTLGNPNSSHRLNTNPSRRRTTRHLVMSTLVLLGRGVLLGGAVLAVIRLGLLRGLVLEVQVVVVFLHILSRVLLLGQPVPRHKRHHKLHPTRQQQQQRRLRQQRRQQLGQPLRLQRTRTMTRRRRR